MPPGARNCCPVDRATSLQKGQNAFDRLSNARHRPINMVSYVCDAQPGIVTTVDLPQVIAKLS